MSFSFFVEFTVEERRVLSALFRSKFFSVFLFVSCFFFCPDMPRFLSFSFISLLSVTLFPFCDAKPMRRHAKLPSCGNCYSGVNDLYFTCSDCIISTNNGACVCGDGSPCVQCTPSLQQALLDKEEGQSSSQGAGSVSIVKMCYTSENNDQQVQGDCCIAQLNSQGAFECYGQVYSQFLRSLLASVQPPPYQLQVPCIAPPGFPSWFIFQYVTSSAGAFAVSGCFTWNVSNSSASGYNSAYFTAPGQSTVTSVVNFNVSVIE